MPLHSNTGWRAILVAPPASTSRFCGKLTPTVTERLTLFSDLTDALEFAKSNTSDAIICHRSILDRSASQSYWREYVQQIPLITLSERRLNADEQRSIASYVDEHLVIDDANAEVTIQAINYAITSTQRHQQYLAALSLVENGVLIVDEYGEIIFLNTAAEILLKKPANKLTGTLFNGPLIPGQTNELILPDKSSALVDAVEIDWLGRKAIKATLKDAIPTGKKAATGQDLSTELDSLTALMTRSSFDEQLASAIRRASAEQLRLALSLITVDKLGFSNDTASNLKNDHLLSQVADRLRKSSRLGTIIARVSNQSFAMVIYNTSIAGEMIHAQRILETLTEPYTISQRTLPASVSIGLATFPESGSTARSLMLAAESAAKEARTQGRNRIISYSSEAVAAAKHSRRLEVALGSAMRREEFSLTFLPYFDTAGKQLHMSEVLLRWWSPEHGAVRPADFIPLAESAGWINAIGEWVFVEACRELSRWMQDPVTDWTRHTLTINVSALQFRDDNFADFVHRVLRETGLKPSQIWLEIAENSLVQHLEESLPSLQKLRDLGVKIALDDFGRGNSSLAYLPELPIDAVKIDRAIVNQIGSSNNTVISAVIKLAKRMDLLVIGEGVETRRELSELKELGCDYVQGYLLAMPMPRKELLRSVIRN